MKNIVSAIPVPSYKLDITFDDGLRKVIDITPFIRQGVSAALSDESFFKKVEVTDGFISWPNGFDFCPEALYQYAQKSEMMLV